MGMQKWLKEELEGAKSKIKEIITIEVIIAPLRSGSSDVILLSEFDSVETLETYQVHKEHLRECDFVG